MRRKTRIINVLMILLMVTVAATALIALVSAQTAVPDQSLAVNGDDSTAQINPSGDLQLEQVTDYYVNKNSGERYPEENKPAIYLVRFIEPALAAYEGGINGYAPTSAKATGGIQLDASTSASVAYRDFLLAKQADRLLEMEAMLNRSVEVKFQYFAGNNGMALWLTPQEAAQVEKMPGVAFVQRDFERELQTDAGPEWIGAPGLWDGSDTGGLPGTQGEGIIIGVIDTGINPSNPSFADIGGDGYDHTNPFGTGNYVGVCDSTNTSPPANVDPYDPTFPCNDKLIGAWGYTDVYTSAWDYDGHGSHTASTAGGNVVTATVTAPTITISRTISGVAPHANIIAYAACCTGSALSAAIDQAIIDGVDVINYSIGSSSPSDVWNDFDSVGFLNARKAGIFVATSAGNDGPDADTVGSPADAPWLTSVGATTHNRQVLNVLMDITSDISSTANITGKGLTTGYGPAPIVYAGWYTNTNDPGGDPAQCLQPFPAGTFTNSEIVVCDRGSIARVAKGQNVLAGGAGGFVLANAASNGESTVADTHFLPGVHVGYTDGQTLKDWLEANKIDNPMATIGGAVFDESPSNGDVMAGFSSRGQNRALPGIVVPSISAPGVDILAAYGTDNAIEWDMISGTSMASPHIAGSAALLMALHPDWTPAQIQSAMMTTSWTDVLDDDGVTPATPFDMGSGRVDLSVASQAGLVLDETGANYDAADPALGGDPKTLNLASFGNEQCLITCSWTREISSTQPVTISWTAAVTGETGLALSVDPPSFDLGPYETKTITVTADVSAAATGNWVFGEVQLSAPSLPLAHFPVAVIPSRGVFPSSIEITAQRNAGSVLIEDIESIEITDLTVESLGLAKATMTDFSLFEDPTNSIPEGFYDDLNQVFWMTMTVPANTQSLIAEIIETTSPDLDMAVGMGSIPTEAGQVCQSASGGSAEFCSVSNPTAGTWWVVVLNWEESAGAPDSVTLATAIVPESDSGNMTFTGPTAVGELTPFDLRLFWDEPGMQEGDKWYGAFSLGSDSANAGNIGTIPVYLTRIDDDVDKSANTSMAMPGDTVTFTISVDPNLYSSEDLAYIVTDQIPNGLTYLPGSASATQGSVVVLGDTLTWVGTMAVPVSFYDMSTSLTDPSCAVPLANSGAYLNLASFGITADSGISGDTQWLSAFSTGDPFNFFGSDYVGMNFTDDGFAFFDSTPGANPWFNEDIPTATDPNNLLATLWSDWEIIYDGPTNRGVSIATLGGVSGGVIIEYDDVQVWGDPGTTYDYEVFMWRTPGAGPEIIFAYDNISGTVPFGTIGVENATGTSGTKYGFDDAAIAGLSDGQAICFDWTSTANPAIITYQATVDGGTLGQITNYASHDNNNPGSKTEMAGVAIQFGLPTYLPVINKD